LKVLVTWELIVKQLLKKNHRSVASKIFHRETGDPHVGGDNLLLWVVTALGVAGRYLLSGEHAVSILRSTSPHCVNIQKNNNIDKILDYMTDMSMG
jgi:hypothetical protein